MSFTSLLDRFSKPAQAVTQPGPILSEDIDNLAEQNSNFFYKTDPKNWYTARPYGFKMNMRDGKRTFIFFLPINPSNIVTTTHFATNVVSTLYGTVEEHSDIRYFDIEIRGSTGFVPMYTRHASGISPAAASDIIKKDFGTPGRASFSALTKVPLGGFFAKTVGAINQIKNKAADLLDGGPKAETGVYTEQTGYFAFHNLYKFLMRHKKDASGADGGVGERKKHPLTFFNYKDNQQYDVVVRNFTLTRSAENPMLYNYAISLRGYNLRGLDDKTSDDLTQRLKDLGLNGVDTSSLLGDIKSVSSSAKAIIGSAVAGINVLGR